MLNDVEQEKEEKSLAGNIDVNIFWEFKNAMTNCRLQVKEAVEIAAKLFINAYNKSRGEEYQYDISTYFSPTSDETKQD